MLKQLLIYYSTISENFMVYFCHLYQIKIFNLFQKYEKTFVKFLILK